MGARRHGELLAHQRAHRGRRGRVRCLRFGRRRRGAQQADADPHKVGGADVLDDVEGQLRRDQHRAHAQARDGDHDGEGREAPAGRDDRRRNAVARAVGDRQQVVGAESHVDGEAGRQEQQIGGQGHGCTGVDGATIIRRPTPSGS